MRALDLNYSDMKFACYEGAGNKTPVLDLSSCVDSSAFSPLEMRTMLEQDLSFRSFLQQEGKKCNADSVMIYYRSCHAEYDFVTFVGEPSADILTPFSDMCGNGIRALALHILLTLEDNQLKNSYLNDGITIWAGELRTIFVESLKSESGTFKVELGPFQSSVQHVNVFVNTLMFPSVLDFSAVRMNGQLKRVSGMLMGFGFNGNESGEPHAILLLKREHLPTAALHVKTNLSVDILMNQIRSIACDIGAHITFNRELFPRGINFSFGIVDANKIFMSTHERNLMPTQKQCLDNQKMNGFCHCNTLACGTGGAAAVNIAFRHGLIESKKMRTIHPGGVLDYEINEFGTVMTGPARRI